MSKKNDKEFFKKHDDVMREFNRVCRFNWVLASNIMCELSVDGHTGGIFPKSQLKEFRENTVSVALLMKDAIDGLIACYDAEIIERAKESLEKDEGGPDKSYGDLADLMEFFFQDIRDAH